ncbi:hypothetical protein NPD8_3834 (plasmid) [Clostridium botulinum]|uniref:Uncharacterized protein n=1 Tax=Clostridium botulinum TaxID=1491 RepID=A0A1L7JMJ8_CLOBO|nr:hypothetical protein NPD8_3834 [Clostridium botulinum]
MLEGIPQGEYVTLTCKGEVVMSNTPMEKGQMLILFNMPMEIYL